MSSSMPVTPPQNKNATDSASKPAPGDSQYKPENPFYYVYVCAGPRNPNPWETFEQVTAWLEVNKYLILQSGDALHYVVEAPKKDDTLSVASFSPGLQEFVTVTQLISKANRVLSRRVGRSERAAQMTTVKKRD